MGCGRIIVPPELIGVPTATLQLWLSQSQAALQQLYAGAKVASAGYGQGDGTKNVTYQQADIGALTQRIRTLTYVLGLSGPRRAIGVSF